MKKLILKKSLVLTLCLAFLICGASLQCIRKTNFVMLMNTNALSVNALYESDIQPNIYLHGASTGKPIATGSYVSERVVISTDSESHRRLRCKLPMSPNYFSIAASSYTSPTFSGWYYAYAEDTNGNTSDTVSFYYDCTPPAGIISSNGASIESGSYINENFSYSATDDESGVTEYFFKTPTSGIFQQYNPGMVINKNSGDGWYYFYSTDLSGNQSSVLSVYLETQFPLVQIYRNDTLSYSQRIEETGDYDTELYLRPNDTLKISCDTSSGNVNCNYELDVNHVIGNDFTNNSYIITITSATGITSNFKYYIVREKPTFTISGKTYNDGETVYLNSDSLVLWNCSSVISETADTGVTILSEGNINLNEFLRYKDNRNKTLLTDEGTETKYMLSQTDRAGNSVSLTVIIDKSAPNGIWSTNGKEIENGGYSNKPLSFTYDVLDVTASYSYNGSEYAPYISGHVFTADGSYTVILTDPAFNKSIFTAYIDTIAPIGQLYADYSPVENGSFTSGKIYFSWDGDITATVNGMPYAKNTVLSNDAAYTFELTDFAGNSTVYNITLDTVTPTYNADALSGSKQMISKWYTVAVGGEDYSFATYDETLAYACEYEFANAVTILHLNSVDDFNQHHLVADNGNADNKDDEIRNGEYWMYKSKAKPDNLLYYFDRNLLSEVISRYAKDYISPVNYFGLDGKNEYGTPSKSMSDNVLIAPDGTDAPVINDFVFERADSTEIYAELIGGDGAKIKVDFDIPFGQQFITGGLYQLTEFDAAGNETVYFGFLDRLAPKLKVSATIFGNDDPTELTIDKEMLAGIAAYYYECFDINAIADADKWAVLTVANGGNTTFYTYGDNMPTLNIGGEYLLTLYDRTGNSYSFTVYIVGSPADIAFKNNVDDTAFDLTITLEQNFDTLVSLQIRRNGVLIEGVSTDTLAYIFDKDGVYTVTLRDNFGRVTVKEYTFAKSLPSGTLSGVENGGKTITDVTFTYDAQKYFAVVYKNGVVHLTDKSGGLLVLNSDSGAYVIRLVNLTDEENYCEYAFVINTPEIDSTAPTVVITGVENGGIADGIVTISEPSEDATVEVYFNGEIIPYELGTNLAEYGDYRIVVTDAAGNMSEYTFTLKHLLNGGSIALVVIGVSLVIVVAVAVFIIRKKGLFNSFRLKRKTADEPTETESK